MCAQFPMHACLPCIEPSILSPCRNAFNDLDTLFAFERVIVAALRQYTAVAVPFSRSFPVLLALLQVCHTWHCRIRLPL